MRDIDGNGVFIVAVNWRMSNVWIRVMFKEWRRLTRTTESWLKTSGRR